MTPQRKEPCEASCAESIKQWSGGKVELKDLLGLSAETLHALRARAQFFVDAGHNERALVMLEMIEAIDRTDRMASLVAIDLLIADGCSDAAAEKVEAMLSRNADDDDAWAAKAELMVRAAQLSEAAPILERLMRADPEATTMAGQRAHALVAQVMR